MDKTWTEGCPIATGGRNRLAGKYLRTGLKRLLVVENGVQAIEAAEFDLAHPLSRHADDLTDLA